MDLDALVAAHGAEWGRLARLLHRARRPRRLSAQEVDELVALYQRTATQLSAVQTRAPDPALVSRLSSLVAQARSVLTGTRSFGMRDVARYLRVTFPSAVYRCAPWWVPTALVSLLVAFGLAVWVAGHPDVQRSLVAPSTVHRLVQHDFAHYYRAHPAGDFAAQVWTNNAYVAAGTLVFGLFLGIPTVLLLALNMVNVGVSAGYLAAAGRTGEFFALVLPHGMLELTAVFVAAGTGLRLGWTVVDPGPLPRAEALAAAGRSAAAVALGLAGVLAVSGAIEAFVTPSPLPTAGRIGIGVLAEVAFLAYVFLLGRRAARAGERGDLRAAEAGETAPVAS